MPSIMNCSEMTTNTLSKGLYNMDKISIKQCNKCRSFHTEEECQACKQREKITQRDKVYLGVFIDGIGCCPLCKKEDQYDSVLGYVCYECGIIIIYD